MAFFFISKLSSCRPVFPFRYPSHCRSRGRSVKPSRCANAAMEYSRVKSWRCATESFANRPLERQQGTDNGTGILGGKEDLPLVKKRTPPEKPPDSRPASLETDKAKDCAGRYGRHFPKLPALTGFLSSCGRRDRQGAGGVFLSRQTGQSLSARKLGGRVELLSLPCSRRTPWEAMNRPQPYPNTPHTQRDACGGKSQKNHPGRQHLAAHG